ncbi:hypothetical protein GF366_03725 [Candidatus Peregrinibacteria bacterium]|nr:hypothetical protein [Candidatus Peregrinibacteria bacterium]
MLNSFRQISLLNKLFNVNGSEWPRIGAAWAICLMYKIGFVIGWTLIVGLFVAKYGIFSLPYLFVLNALFTIAGTFFLAAFLDRYRKQYIMVFTLLFAAFSLFLAYYFSSSSQPLFFSFLVLAEAFFLVHFKILFTGTIEENFTPIESERTFPLIESSETIGGIIAGLIVVLMSNYIPLQIFVLIWTGIVLIMIPCIFLYEHLNKKVKVIPKIKPKRNSFQIYNKIKNELANSNAFSYLKGLFLIVLFQWFLYNLMEFQYTKAVYQSVSSVVIDSGSGFEHSLVHDLGQFFILFSVAALLIQLFIGSRLISSLGIFGSMLLHPLVTLLSVFGMTISFSLPSAILAKTNYTITSIIHLNAYHSSYYAIKENFREHVRQFLDGIVRPLGAVFGTLILILLQRFFTSASVVFAVNISMIIVCFVIFVVTYIQQVRYTSVALDELINSKDKKRRYNAIDILAQKGHKSSIPFLRKILLNKKEPVSVRVRILKAFSELQDLSVVSDIIKCLKSEESAIRYAALDTLLSYKILYKKKKEHMVLEHRLIETLKNLYEKEIKDEIRFKIISVLSNISSVASFEHLLGIVKNKKGKLKAEAIYALGNYDDENVVKYIRPYLSSKNLDIKIAAVIAMGKFKSSRDEAVGIISNFLHSKNNKKIEYALYAIGELNIRKKKKECLKYTHSKNIILKMKAGIALAKMGYDESIPVLVNLVFSGDYEIANNIKKLCKNVDVRISKNFDKIVKHLVSEKIEKLAPCNCSQSLDSFDSTRLINLKQLYCLAEEYDEVESINNILNS